MKVVAFSRHTLTKVGDQEVKRFTIELSPPLQTKVVALLGMPTTACQL